MNAECALRGTRWRASLPAAARTLVSTHGRAVQMSFDGGRTFQTVS
jgi:hypothetical protein